MAKAPGTRPSLLIRLRDFQDHEAWTAFVDGYAPVIYGFLRKRGLQDADAADVTQACLRQVAVHVGSLVYDPERGTFRGWLFTIVRNKLRDFYSQTGVRNGTGDSAVQRLLESRPAPEDADVWEREYRNGMLAWAAAQVRPHVQDATWQAFWQTAVQGIAVQEVAQALGLSSAAVYQAKSRVTVRLRALIQETYGES
jgi:RNA polymerase sigma-70 factor (ECF subfamily)